MNITAMQWGNAEQTVLRVTLADGEVRSVPWPCKTWHAAVVQRWLDEGGVIAPAADRPAPVDLADVDNVEKALKALGLVVATWTNHSPAQLKAAFRQAWNSLP